MNILPSIPVLITYAIILLTAFPVHEFAHAWVADRFGDDTPRINGRLTLNPLAHLDPIGSLMMIIVGFGWAKPVPINPYALQRRSPAATMWVSLAGPMSNFMMAIVAAVLYRIIMVLIANPNNTAISFLQSLLGFLVLFVFTNLWLMLFNLIPLFPLDGEKVLDYFLPPSAARVLESIRPYGPIILMAIIFLPRFIGVNVIGSIISPVLNQLTFLLIGV